MRRIILLTVSLLILCAFSFSQNIKIPVASQSEIKKFYSTTTHIVLKNEFMSDYNTEIQALAEKFWTITPIKFIKESEFNKLRNDTDKSFLMITQVYFEEDKSKTMFDFLILSLGGKYKTINDMPNICAIPLCYSGDEEENYLHKLGAMLKHCQTHVELCRKNTELTKDNIANYYLKNSGNLQEKTLYVQKNELAEELRNEAKFKEIYQYGYKFSNPSEIKTLIANEDANAVIAHIISPLSGSSLSYCIKILIDVKDGLIYYYDMHKTKKHTEGNLLSSDIKKISNKK